MLNEKWLVAGVNLEVVFQTHRPDWGIDEKRTFSFDIFDARIRCPYPRPAGRDPISSIKMVAKRAWKRQPCRIVHLSDASCFLGGLYNHEGRPVAGFGSAGFLKMESRSTYRTTLPQNPKKICPRPLVILNTGTNNFYHFIVDVMAPASSVLSFLKKGLVDRVIFYGPKPGEGSFNEGFFKHFERLCNVPIQFEEKSFFVQEGFFLLPRLSDYVWSDEGEFFAYADDGHPYPFSVSDAVGYFFNELTEEIPPVQSAPPILIISRLHLQNRKIVNEGEIFEALRDMGAATMKMEDYSVVDQIGLIKSSKVLIGCHGAGMFNAGFLPSDGMAIEVTGRQYAKRSRDFCKITAAKGLRYSYIIADEVGDNFNMVANKGNNLEISALGIEKIVSYCRNMA